MKIFVVYAKVELTQKPSWLDAFRIKYDKPYEYHITLKQPCLIEDDQITDIKNKLNNLFSNLKIPNQTISLTFNSLNCELRNLSQARFLNRLSQADEPRMSDFSAEKYATVQKVAPRKSFVIHDLNIPEHTLDNICIMIKATNTDQIDKLQHDVVLTFFEYNQYQKTEYKQYEENFEPHITIARNLDNQSYLSASEELKQDYTCRGVIKEVVLAIVNNPVVSEVNNPKNQTIYSFK